MLIRKLREEDIDLILGLTAGNTLFYKYHPPVADYMSIQNDMHAVPPGVEKKDKYYMGLFDRDDLIAVMDLIVHYPQKKTAFIGFLMIKAEEQHHGLGSEIVADLCASLKAHGFEKVRLAVDHGNPQSLAFWQKNGFSLTNEDGRYRPMERMLSDR